MLLDHGKKTFYHFCLPLIGFDQGTEPEDLALLVIRMLIRQLLNCGDSRLQYAMEHYPLSELTQPRPHIFKPQHWILEHLFQVLFYSLVAVPESCIYLVIDGIDMLGPVMYQFLGHLHTLYVKLLEVEDNKNISIKLIFATRPRNFSQPLNDQEELLNTIPYIEKDKELNGLHPLRRKLYLWLNG
jgi:hypothetical protein